MGTRGSCLSRGSAACTDRSALKGKYVNKASVNIITQIKFKFKFK
jgi:hypothetical protein